MTSPTPPTPPTLTTDPVLERGARGVLVREVIALMQQYHSGRHLDAIHTSSQDRGVIPWPTTGGALAVRPDAGAPSPATLLEAQVRLTDGGASWRALVLAHSAAPSWGQPERVLAEVQGGQFGVLALTLPDAADLAQLAPVIIEALAHTVQASL